MSRLFRASCLALGVAACSNGTPKFTAREHVGNYRPESVSRVLPDGAQIDAWMRQELSSYADSVAETVEAVTRRDVTNAAGTVVIPAGSTVLLTIVALQSAREQGNRSGLLVLVAHSITVDGTTYPLSASTAPIRYALVVRSIAPAERVVIIGGIGDTAAAIRYLPRDVVVAPGTPVVLTLTQSLTVSPK